MLYLQLSPVWDCTRIIDDCRVYAPMERGSQKTILPLLPASGECIAIGVSCRVRIQPTVPVKAIHQ